MADIPLEGRKKVPPKKEHKIEITKDNADVLATYYLIEIYKRLGYLIKRIEGKQ